MRIQGINLVMLTLSVLLYPFSTYAYYHERYIYDSNFEARMPSRIEPSGEKMIIVDPRVHAWGAYDPNGYLVHGGLASAGSNWCPDLGHRCHTRSGSFRIYSLGGAGCYSHKFPLGRGGAPMPYCMYFNGGQGLHGSYELGDANLSHGCVRMTVDSARWLRYDFVDGPNSENGYRGTRVIVESY